MDNRQCNIHCSLLRHYWANQELRILYRKNATSEHYFDMISYIFMRCTPWCHNYAHLSKQPHMWLHCIWQGSSIKPSLLFCVAYLTAHFNFTFVYDCARIIHKQRHIFDPKHVLATIVTSSTKAEMSTIVLQKDAFVVSLSSPLLDKIVPSVPYWHCDRAGSYWHCDRGRRADADVLHLVEVPAGGWVAALCDF